METENTLTTAEESLNELFFEEEARLWACLLYTSDAADE